MPTTTSIGTTKYTDAELKKAVIKLLKGSKFKSGEKAGQHRGMKAETMCKKLNRVPEGSTYADSDDILAIERICRAHRNIIVSSSPFGYCDRDAYRYKPESEYAEEKAEYQREDRNERKAVRICRAEKNIRRAKRADEKVYGQNIGYWIYRERITFDVSCLADGEHPVRLSVEGRLATRFKVNHDQIVPMLNACYAFEMEADKAGIPIETRYFDDDEY